MDKENVVHLLYGKLLAIKNKVIMNFADKRVKLENIILSDTQKEMYGMYSLITGH